jgi:hypothetical protein
MSDRLEGSLDEHAGAISDVLEGLLATWKSMRLPPARAMELVRTVCHELSQWRDAGLGSSDPLAPIDRAQHALESACELSPADDRTSLEELLAELGALRRNALERVGFVVPVVGAAVGAGLLASSFIASVAEPALRQGVVVPPLSLLRTQVAIDEILAGAASRELHDDDDELDELEDARAGAGPSAAQLEERRRAPAYRQLHALGRDLMEDLGALGSLRRPLDDESWVGPEHFEQRLLEQLDALFSLAVPGDPAEGAYALIEELHAYATEWAVPDLGRAFALALPLASIDGEPAARWLMTILRHTDRHAHPAIVDALCLGPSPRIPGAIASALSGTEDSRVMLALLEAARRRADVAPSAIVLALGHDDESVVAAALRALGRVDPAVSGPILSEALGSGGLGAVAAAEALAGFGAPHALVTLRGWLEGAHATPEAELEAERSATALEVLACLGDPADEPLVLRAALARPGRLRSLGVYGYPPHAELLFERWLDAEQRLDAQRGLRIMLGGDFDTDASAVERDPPLRDALERDRAERRALAREARGRLRRGAPHRGAITLLEELSSPSTSGLDHLGCFFELGMLMGAVLPFDPHTWIARKRAGIEMLRAAVGRG